MVFIGGRSEQEIEDSSKSFNMAMGPEGSRSMHNFSLPCLKWGGHKQIRCARVHEDVSGDQFRALGRRSPPTSSQPYRDSAGLSWKNPEPERKRRYVVETEDLRISSSRFLAEEVKRRHATDSDGDDGIEAVRKKLMLDLQAEMNKMKFAVLSEGCERIEPPPPTTTRPEDPPADEARSWNLRTRRAVCKVPNANGANGGGKSQRVDQRNSSFSPTKVAMKSSAKRSDVVTVDHAGVKRPRLSVKVSIPLSKQEIEEDFIAMTGVRPPRRPKKRPRNVQKQLDQIFPRLWLKGITTDRYKVNENPEAKKR